jgi:hypothetical protein
MGHLNYGDHSASVEIEDRALTHLQFVIIGKLRRQESFTFSWIEPPATGSGRNSIWLHPWVTLRFKFAGNRTPSLNTVWIAQLTDLANSPGGLRCTTEPVNTTRLEQNPFQGVEAPSVLASTRPARGSGRR